MSPDILVLAPDLTLRGQDASESPEAEATPARTSRDIVRAVAERRI